MVPLSLVFAASLMAAVAPAPPDRIHTGSDAEQRMTVAVLIGDKGPFQFLVDTGAQNTVLADTLASRLGLAPDDHGVVVGVAGILPVRTVSLRDVRMDGHSFDDSLVPLLPANGIGADGIIGIDGLQNQRVLFDFSRHLLTVTDVRRPAEGDGYEIVVTARRRKGQLIVTHATVDGIDTDVVIDTGAEISIGNRALQRALAKHQPSVPTRVTSVTGQEIGADLAIGGTLTIDRLSIRNFEIAYVDAPVFAALRLDRHPAILLGLRELRTMKRITIDFAQRIVKFDVSG